MKRIKFIAGLIFLLALNPAFCEKEPRYISLAPSTTEVLFALGLDKEIIGVSSYCNYPLSAKEKEKVGTFSQPNIEKILYLRPDYIFCTGLEQNDTVIKLKRLNLKIYVQDPKNMAELFASIKEIGDITGKKIEAEKLIKDMQAKLDEISGKVKNIPLDKRPRVFIEIWHDPLTTAGKNSFIDNLITLAGGINIAGDTKRPYSIFSQEEVIKRDPDYIILTYMDKEKPIFLIKRRLGWSKIKAVKNNRVYNDIDPDILLRPGPRAVLGLEEIYKKLFSTL